MKNLNFENFEKLDLPFKVNRLSPNIGAELLEIDLREDFNKETYELIYQALLIYKVIFFREQHLSTEDHLRFAKQFGELEVHPFAPHKEGYPEVLSITHNEKSKGRENTWHSDVTWREEPSLGSILRMIEGPQVGGDTLFSEMCLAYDGLSDEVKKKLEGAIAVHDFAGFRQGNLPPAGKPFIDIAAVNCGFFFNGKKIPNESELDWSLPVCEDIHMVLQLFKKGYKNRIWDEFGYISKILVDGGCMNGEHLI